MDPGLLAARQAINQVDQWVADYVRNITTERLLRYVDELTAITTDLDEYRRNVLASHTVIRELVRRAEVAELEEQAAGEEWKIAPESDG